VPDATTLWRFRGRLKKLGLIETLFDRFGDGLSPQVFKPGGDANDESRFCGKGRAASALGAEKQANTRMRSRTRCRVPHAVGFRHNSMGGKLIRTVGLARVEVKIGIRGMTYNLLRDLQPAEHL
jgi:IS5 family transposase